MTGAVQRVRVEVVAAVAVIGAEESRQVVLGAALAIRISLTISTMIFRSDLR
jgi:hypothetical protein